MRVALALCLVAALAGCAAAPASSASHPASSAASSSGPPLTAAFKATAPAAAKMRIERDALTFSGDVGIVDCARSGGSGFCPVSSFGPPTDPLGYHARGLGARRGVDLHSGNLTLTWQALAPTTTELEVVAHVMQGCPDQCRTDAQLVVAHGPSPLHLVLPGKQLHGDQVVAFDVEPYWEQGGLVLYLAVGQSFDVVGNLDYAVPA